MSEQRIPRRLILPGVIGAEVGALVLHKHEARRFAAYRIERVDGEVEAVATGETMTRPRALKALGSLPARTRRGEALLLGGRGGIIRVRPRLPEEQQRVLAATVAGLTRAGRAARRTVRPNRRGTLQHFGALATVMVLAAVLIPATLTLWFEDLELHAEVSTGELQKEVDGDLTFDYDGCTPGSTSTECTKFEGSEIGPDALPTFTVGDATFQITQWIDKSNDPGDHVGFFFTVTGGTLDLVIKSGSGELDLTGTPPGSHQWLNPACTLNLPTPAAPTAATATCTPRNTSAISNIVACITVVTEFECPPAEMALATVTNTGSVSFVLAMTLGQTGGTDYCDPEAFDLTIHRTDGAGNPQPPPLFEGPCASSSRAR